MRKTHPRSVLQDPVAGPLVDMRTEGESLREALPKEGGLVTLSPELGAAMARLIREGNTLANAARVCGVRWRKLQSWLQTGAADLENDVTETPEAQLAYTLHTALGDQEWALSRAVMQTGKEDAKVALETLGRRFPNEWAPAAPEPVDNKQMYEGMSRKELVEEVKRLMAQGEKDES